MPTCFPQLVSIGNINYLNIFVFTVNACCTKNIFIHNLDKFVQVSARITTPTSILLYSDIQRVHLILYKNSK